MDSLGWLRGPWDVQGLYQPGLTDLELGTQSSVGSREGEEAPLETCSPPSSHPA